MQLEERIRSHVREIDRCNQRGGRFLSVIDLLDAETVNLDAAAYLGAAILAGNSFLVGALPGGAGKTTVMGAFLNFVPPDTELAPAVEGVPGAALRGGASNRCFICHEIGRGPYFAYLWGKDVRDLFRLPRAGIMAVGNLHADTVQEAREIVVEGCGVPEEDFAAWPLFFFLELEGGSFRGVKRRVASIWEGPERLIYRLVRDSGGKPSWRLENEPLLGDSGTRERVRELLEDLRASGKRRIEDVRRAVLARFG